MLDVQRFYIGEIQSDGMANTRHKAPKDAQDRFYPQSYTQEKQAELKRREQIRQKVTATLDSTRLNAQLAEVWEE